MDHNVSQVPISDFINQELILFSMADNIRSIPSVVDGFKPGQRKVLFACFKRKLKAEIKVSGRRRVTDFSTLLIAKVPLSQPQLRRSVNWRDTFRSTLHTITATYHSKARSLVSRSNLSVPTISICLTRTDNSARDCKVAKTLLRLVTSSPTCRKSQGPCSTRLMTTC